MRLLILILFFTIPTTAQTVRARPRCTEPPVATPCIDKDGNVKRHTVPEWQEIERRRNEGMFFANLIGAVKQMGPLPWVVVGVCVVVVVILQRAKRRVSRIEANFNEQRNIAIDAIELAERQERELKRRKAA